MKIALILPSLGSGGLEKVITELACFFSRQKGKSVYIVSLTRGVPFYSLPENIQILIPPFGIEELPRPIFLIRLFFWLRKNIKIIAPSSLISFGGKYNSFVLLALYGLPIRTFISDRSRPSMSYGFFLDWLNPRIYKKATGIVAQTEQAEKIMFTRTNHSNIRIIGNPIRIFNLSGNRRENMILNVGRFIPSKHQELLVDYYLRIRPQGWKLNFLGDGGNLDDVKKKVMDLGMVDEISFQGVIKDIHYYYGKSMIFAFTSVSEGFPNALGEAMAAGLACISFDCEAGPADLIDDGENGFLVPVNDHDEYIRKLSLLVNDVSLCEKFGHNAQNKITAFSSENIGNMYLDFINH